MAIPRSKRSSRAPSVWRRVAALSGGLVVAGGSATAVLPRSVPAGATGAGEAARPDGPDPGPPAPPDSSLGPQVGSVPDSRELSAPLIASGQVRDPDGAPVPAAVVLFSEDRPSLDLEPGATFPLLPVARTTTDPDGHFVLRSAVTDALARNATDGTVNLTLMAFAASGQQGTFVARDLAGHLPGAEISAASGWSDPTSEDGGLVPVDLVVAPAATGGGVSPAAADADAPDVTAASCSSRVVDRWTDWVKIGEYQSNDSFVDGSFQYGRTADSSIEGLFHAGGVIVAAAGDVTAAAGGWSVTGAAKVSNSSSVTVLTNKLKGKIAYTFFGDFRFEQTYHPCATALPYVPYPWTDVRAVSWRGGTKYTDRSRRVCPANYKIQVPRNSVWKRFDKKAANYQAAVTVFGIGLRAQSGYSSSLGVTFRTGAQRGGSLCGTNAAPTTAGVVFAP